MADILAKYFTEHKTFWWLVKDEYTKETLPTTTVSFRLSLDLCLLVGDPWQRPRSVQGQYLSSGMNTCAWVEQEKVVDLYQINKSWRLGRTMCRVISAVLPECKLLESARPDNGDTLFLPILFKSLDGWEYGYGADPEVARNRFIFSHVMSVISLEIFLAVTCPTSSASRGIVVVSFLNELLDGLENYLYSQLESACAMLHRLGDLPLPAEGFSIYSYQRLKKSKLLMLETVVPAGGFDRQVAMLLGCHRRAGDKGPQGLMTEFNALLIGLSRGIDRFYLFTEDMRDQIFVPLSGELHREGSAHRHA